VGRNLEQLSVIKSSAPKGAVINIIQSLKKLKQYLTNIYALSAIKSSPLLNIKCTVVLSAELKGITIYSYRS
jgi:hypothetical protein